MAEEEQAVAKADTGWGLTEFLTDEVTEESEDSSLELQVESEENDVIDEQVSSGDGEESTAEEVSEDSEWESESNPYKAKAEEMERRYVETRNWTTQVNQELAELRKQQEVVGKKLDGTYDEDEESQAPESAELYRQQEQQSRVNASIIAANQIYGEDVVQNTLFNEDAPFRQFDNDAVVQGRVMAAEAPAIEAMNFMKEHNFFEKYGRDPDEIVQKIRSELREEIEKELSDDVKNKFNKRLAISKKQISGVAAATGAPDVTTKRKGDKPAFQELGAIVNNGFV